MILTFFCQGTPKPGGSKRGFLNRKTGRVIVTEDCKTSKDWRATVALCGSEAMAGREMFTGPLIVDFSFCFPRPKGHFRKDGVTLTKSAPAYPTTRPDCTKVIRSTEDACTGIVWRDDALIVSQHASKRYGTPGCTVTVEEM